MKFQSSLLAAALTFAFPAFVGPAHAQEQVTESLVCESALGSRTSCSVTGEILSAGIERQIGEGTPCFLGYTWGFEENGIWTGNGCSAQFSLVVERAAAQPVVDPEVLKSRLKNTRKKLRKARQDLVAEQESRRALEAELAEAQSALRIAEAAAPKTAKRKNKSQVSTRNIASCSNRAVRSAKKTGASVARVVEIVSARPTQGSWLVIGRMTTEIGGTRSLSYFRCWTENGKVISYENTI